MTHRFTAYLRVIADKMELLLMMGVCSRDGVLYILIGNKFTYSSIDLGVPFGNGAEEKRGLMAILDVGGGNGDEIWNELLIFGVSNGGGEVIADGFL